jgi:hypothetical protein
MIDLDKLIVCPYCDNKTDYHNNFIICEKCSIKLNVECENEANSIIKYRIWINEFNKITDYEILLDVKENCYYFLYCTDRKYRKYTNIYSRNYPNYNSKDLFTIYNYFIELKDVDFQNLSILKERLMILSNFQ